VRKSKFIDFPILRPKLSLTIGSLLLVLAFPFLSKLQFDFSVKSWLSPSDPNIVKLEEFERLFGNDERLIVYVELARDQELFSSGILHQLHALTEELWKIPYVIRVDSLANAMWSYADGPELITEPFLPLEELESIEFLRKRELEALDHDVFSGVYFSEDLRSALLYARLAHHPDKQTNFTLIARSAMELAAKHSNEQIEVHLLGEPIMSYWFQKKCFDDLKLIIPVLFVLLILYLLMTFRSLAGVLLPLSVIAPSIVVTMGFAGLIGAKINSLTFILPTILMAISVADSIHVLATFFDRLSLGKPKLESMRLALDKNFAPIILTSLSTAIGFLSLMTSDVLPVKNLGMLAAVGTMSAMVFTYLFIPALGVLLPLNEAQGRRVKQKSLPRAAVRTYLLFLMRYRKTILCTFALIVFASIFIASKNEINSSPFSYFKANDPVSLTNDRVLARYNGVSGPEIVIDSRSNEGVKEPAFLRKLEAFQDWLQGHEGVNKAFSIVDTLKEMNKALHEGDEAEFRIHDRREVIAQELFLYTLSLPLGLDINNQVDLEQRRLRLSLYWAHQDAKSSIKHIEKIEQYAAEQELDVMITGKGVLYQVMNGYVVSTFLSSFSMALLLITLMLIFLMKSFKVGLLSLIPNFVPILWGAALLSLMNVPIDIGSAIVASVTLGIIVDDSIHFFTHYKKCIAQGMGQFDALVEVIATTGLALIMTTIILITCFLSFLLGGLLLNIHFGLLCSLVVLTALICDLLVVPALLVK
jgi:uncharacterized protein